MIALNCLGPYPFGYYPNAYDLLMFGLGSFVIISMLLLYHNKISKSNNSISELDNPIYQTKDILLQSNNNNLIITQSTTSTWVKILVFILIAFVVIIPVDQLFSLVNRFY